jgi:hypothetical protein
MDKQVYKDELLGWECSLVVKHLPSMCEALGSISHSTGKEKKKPKDEMLSTSLPNNE